MMESDDECMLYENLFFLARLFRKDLLMRLSIVILIHLN